MAAAALKAIAPDPARTQAWCGSVERCGMHHEHGRGAIEKACIEQLQLAAVIQAFLAGCAENLEPCTESRDFGCQTQSGTDTDGCNQVVTARMTQAGQRV